MRSHGKITKWFDDKGYGFITSEQGENVFLHLSAFKTTGLRANIGDRVSYKIAKGDKGLQAYDLEFLDKTRTPYRSEKHPSKPRQGNKLFPLLLITLLLVLVFVQFKPEQIPSISGPQSYSEDFVTTIDEANFQCLGKTRCNEMASCEEAVFYLENCPGTISDGDGDGIPCEDQWCGH